MPEKHIPEGRFITLEGGEGAGKSTQARFLADFLRGQGHEVVVTREPGGSPFAEKIRAFILSGKAKKYGASVEAALFALARADHVRKVIRPALARGAWVICDRFSDSTLAYQGYLGRASVSWLRFLDFWAVGKTQPDATFVLDIPAEQGLARASLRAAPDRFEAEGAGFHARLRDVFLLIARQNPERCHVIDAQGNREEIAQRIEQAVLQIFPQQEAV